MALGNSPDVLEMLLFDCTKMVANGHQYVPVTYVVMSSHYFGEYYTLAVSALSYLNLERD